MGHLKLALLGKPAVYHDEAAVEFATRKALALLIYLAVEEGMHGREKLAAIFWPQSNTTSGRANLRNTLARLRKPLRHAHGENCHLLVERDALGFKFDSDFTSDWALLQEVVGARTTSSLKRVVEQYRGDFLDGFILGDALEFDDWAGLRREQAHRQMETVFDRLSQLQLEAGDTAASITTTNRWLQHNPHNEVAYRRLMRLHLIRGDKAAALVAYEQCRAALARDLAVDPQPETEALAQRIEDPHLLVGDPEKTPSRPQRQTAMIGRSREHQQLVATFQRCAVGQSQLVVIEGVAGVGKTRLASEFLQWAAGEGADVLRARAFEAGGRLPYGPLLQALRLRLEALNAPEDLLSDVWLTELSRLLPEVRDRYRDLPPPADGEAAQNRLFEAVARLGEGLAEKAPLILFLDDLQWADAATLDLLHYLVARWTQRDAAILMLLALRQEALLEKGPLQDSALTNWLESVARDIGLQRLRLKPLSAGQTAQWIRSLAGEGRETARFAEWLYAETGGQPFYVTETLKALQEQGWLREVGTAGEVRLDLSAAVVDERIHPDLDGFLPPGVHKVVRERLGRLSTEAFSLAAAGAVLGQEFDFRRLCRVAGMTEPAALPALDDLLGSRVFQETNRAERPYAFSHDKIRDVVYTEAGDARRRYFHRQALSTLGEEGAPAAELAQHALGAGLPEQAVRHNVDAGDEAMALFAVRDAVGYYEQARQILSEQSGLHLKGELLLHLTARLGRAYDILGKLEQAETVYREMAALAADDGELAQQALALNRLADVKAYQHDLPSALSLLDQALDLAERSGDRRVLAESHWNVAHMGLYGGDQRRMEEHGHKALALARQVQDSELIARCLNVLAYNARNQGQVQEALAFGEEALQRYWTLNDRALEADCLGLLSQVHLMAGRPRSAASHARQALSISREIESAHGVGFSLLTLELSLLECGQLEEAASLIEDPTPALTAEQNVHEWIMAQLLVAMVQRALGDVEAALATDEASLAALREQEGDVPFPLEEIIAIALTEDYALLDEWEAAADYAKQLSPPSPGIWLFLLVQFRWWLVVEALLRDGQRARAEAILEQIGAQAKGLIRLQVPQKRALAVLARWDGSLDRAIAHLEEAEALSAEMDLSGQRWPALVALAKLHEERGDEEAAGEARRRAAEILRSLADGIEDTGLRATFLTRPTAREVLDADH